MERHKEDGGMDHGDLSLYSDSLNPDLREARNPRRLLAVHLQL
jgi:hypothetical protein